MDFPKYVETADGALVIFDPVHAHSCIAARLDCSIVSAGFASAKCTPKGAFFGESVTLKLAANRALDWSQYSWFEATLERDLVFATEAELLERLGASNIRQASWHSHEEVLFPSAGVRSNEDMLNFFLP